MNKPVYKVVPLSSLHEDPANARKHGERNRQVVRSSLKEFGQVETLVVTKEGRVLGGNCRLQELRALGVEEVSVMEVDLNGVDATRLALVLNRSAELAEWDEGILGQLLEDAGDLESLGWDPDQDQVQDPGEEEASDYTNKVISPIYEPTFLEAPPIDTLMDTTKTDALIREIEAASADVPEEVRGFLRAAAQRHTVFHMRNIAEYYAHADPDVQDLMERSALVIIDYNKALEHGFVRVTERMMEIWGDHEG